MHHIEEMFINDIIYNFLIGEDGNVYEGRGWNYRDAIRIERNAGVHDDNGVSIALIGNFTRSKHLPSITQIRNIQYLIEQGIHDSKILPKFEIILERDLQCSLQHVPQFAAAKVFENNSPTNFVLKILLNSTSTKECQSY